MLDSLHVEGFRGLKSLEVERLARINLFVGMNQSGKTSLLDAVQILLDRGSPRTLYECQARRDERFVVRYHEDGSQTVAPRLDTLFHGAKLRPGARFKVRANAVEALSVDIAVEANGAVSLPKLHGDRGLPGWAEAWSRLAICVRTGADAERHLPIPYDESTLQTFLNNGNEGKQWTPSPLVDFIDVGGLHPSRLVELWGEVALTPREEQLVTELRVIEPDLEGIRLIPGLHPSSHSELVFKLGRFDDRLHLGDMGEGFRRMLGLLLCLPATPRTELLVDEIDTGLHYSILPPMWRLVLETARRRDLQVFATTHSWDCVTALGKLYQLDPAIESEILLHRIDPDHDRVTTYGADAINTITQQQIEVRG